MSCTKFIGITARQVAICVAALSAIPSAALAQIACPIRLGNVFPQSGGAAAIGQSFERGLRMGLEEVNNAGGVLGCKVELVSYDSQSQPANAATLVQRLLFQDRVPLVVGSPISLESLAMLEVTEANKLPLYVPSAASAKITNQGAKWVWRQSVIDLQAARAMADYLAIDLKWKRISVIYENTDYGRLPVEQIILPRLKELGVQTTSVDAVNPGDSDLSSQLLRTRTARPDGLLFWGHDKEAALLARQMTQLGLSTRIAANTGLVFPSFLELLPPDVQKRTNLIAIAQFVWTATEPRQASWIKAFQARFSKTPDTSALDAYDAAFVLKAAIEKAKSLDAEKLRAALFDVRFEGVGGSISFDKTGQAQRPLVIVKLTSKEGPGFEVVKTIAAAGSDKQ